LTDYSVIIHEGERNLTKWTGVYSAVTTKFDKKGEIDRALLEKHYNMQINAGVHGLVVLGSLGENATLTAEEKQEIVRTAVTVSNKRVPVLAAVSETTTLGACRFVEKASANGADGFMVLPGMLYISDRRESIQHFRTVASATQKPIMLYNNPVAYRVDITPEMFAELADEPKFVAIKESSDDVRRINDIRNLVGDRYQIFTGVDDLALESLILGAAGWVAGLVCAFPRETVVLYHLVKAGRIKEALELYRWFIPLLHLDVSIKFVQNIKLAEAIVGCGTEYVRAPRLTLAEEERKHVEKIVRAALKKRPALPKI
jgi:4-hydroxy-tetrahydrodipicolinate synthase